MELKINLKMTLGLIKLSNFFLRRLKNKKFTLSIIKQKRTLLQLQIFLEQKIRQFFSPVKSLKKHNPSCKLSREDNCQWNKLRLTYERKNLSKWWKLINFQKKILTLYILKVKKLKIQKNNQKIQYQSKHRKKIRMIQKITEYWLTIHLIVLKCLKKKLRK